MFSFWLFLILAIVSSVAIFVNVLYCFKLKGLGESIEEKRSEHGSFSSYGKDINTSK